MDTPHFVYSLISSSWTLSYFHFLALINNVILNSKVQDFMWTYASISLGCTRKSGITESHDKFMFNLFGNSQTVFQNNCTILHSHQQSISVQTFPHSFQQFLTICHFHYSHSNEWKVIISCGFDLHFPNE